MVNLMHICSQAKKTCLFCCNKIRDITSSLDVINIIKKKNQKKINRNNYFIIDVFFLLPSIVKNLRKLPNQVNLFSKQKQSQRKKKFKMPDTTSAIKPIFELICNLRLADVRTKFEENALLKFIAFTQRTAGTGGSISLKIN